MKRVRTESLEVDIATFFSTDARKKDADNHCVPILEVFSDDEDPTVSYMVMPCLRLLDDPPFSHINDIVDVVDQLLEVNLSAASRCIL